MPNWCYNKLVITGAGSADVRAFLQKHGEAAHIPASQRFCYDWIVPEPREEEQPPAPPKPSSDAIRDQIAAAQTVDELRAALTHLTPEPAPTGHDWYTWRLTRWGCKWDTSDVDVNDSDPDQIIIRWESPWSPPRKAIRAFAYQFQTAEFTHTFGEPGCDFGGHDYYEGGVCVESEDTDFSATEWFDPADYADDDADEE